ncbi:MAG: AIPR family protein [Thermodesulfobacteriota bacterium]
MHRIIKSHLDNFSKSFEIIDLDENTQFEMFANYTVITPRVGAEFELEDITTSNSDDGMDGVAILIDEEVIVSDADANTIFKSDKKNHDVEIVFIQAKRGEQFDLGEFLKFKESIIRFVDSDNFTVNDDVQINAHEIYEVCLKNVPKIRGGKPQITARFIATGVYREPEALEKAKKKLERSLKETGYFAGIDVKFIGRDELTDLWVSTYAGIQAQLPIFSNAPLPKISGIEEAYLVVAKAKDVVENLLENDDGNLRTQVFEENVRSFLGIDNPVNKSIAETINDAKASTRFPVLNNGITIVSPDVRVQGNILHLENYQIVNGCQTSNVLYENRKNLNDRIMVNLKIIETSNEDVFAELVRATNSQSKIEDTQFFSLRPIVKRVEQYFDSFEDSDGRLYFERRDKQFVGRDIPAVRVFSVNTAAKCVSAMFLHRPELSYRYPKQMYEDLGEKIFADDNKEILFYCASLALYRIHLLISNGTIPQNMRKYKWHILAILRVIISGKEMPALNARKIEPYCQKIVDALSKHGTAAITPIKKAVTIVTSLGEISGDRLKRQAVLDEMLKAGKLY